MNIGSLHTEVSGVFTSSSSETDELKKVLRARKFSRAFEKRRQAQEFRCFRPQPVKYYIIRYEAYRNNQSLRDLAVVLSTWVRRRMFVVSSKSKNG